jgi:putative Mg2+ transporter-C (MgtC) family protein
MLAFALSSIVGLEREFRGKSAGVRTHCIVGTASALMMLVSKYGFGDVVAVGLVNLDPSRVAAQIVSGVGFLGAGLIITRRAIRGLTTTAAVIWEGGHGVLRSLLARCTAHTWKVHSMSIVSDRSGHGQADDE